MKVVCITGTRADYGIYRPILKEMQSEPTIELKLVVTGMHLDPQYGETLTEIMREPYDIIATPAILFKGDSTLAMSQSFGMAVLYFSDLLHFHKPDFILLLGDRGEMLAAAVAAHYQNIGIVHLHGGEVSGSADDAIRHCLSKLAHLHFVSCLEAGHRLRQFGEASWRIVPIGSLRKTEIVRVRKTKQAVDLSKKYGLDLSRTTILFVMHPDSKEETSFEKQIEEALASLSLSSSTHTQIIMIGPNSDAGGDIFLRKIDSFISGEQRAFFYPTVPSDHFLYLLSQVDVLVGNSSSGIIEAPFFQLPFVHIGARQKNRTQGDNVRNVPYDRVQISRAIKQQLATPRSQFTHNPYDLKVVPERKMLAQFIQLARRQDLLHK